MCSSRANCGWARRMLPPQIIHDSSWIFMQLWNRSGFSSMSSEISSSDDPSTVRSRPLTATLGGNWKSRTELQKKKGVIAWESNCFMPDFAFGIPLRLLLTWGGLWRLSRSMATRKLNLSSGQSFKVRRFFKKIIANFQNGVNFFFWVKQVFHVPELSFYFGCHEFSMVVLSFFYGITTPGVILRKFSLYIRKPRKALGYLFFEVRYDFLELSRHRILKITIFSSKSLERRIFPWKF